jgi:hypothetical protein
MKRNWQYYKRLAALYRSYRRRDGIVPAPPLRLWVEISSRCNLRCVVCPNKDLPPGQRGDMEWPLFRSIIDQARTFALELNLHHRGESLLHPEAGRFIRAATASGIPCRLHTNATLLRGPVVDDILDSGLERLSISMDGFSAAAYEKIRCGASFDQVMANIAGFLRRRGELNRSQPRMTIEVMDLPAAGDRSGQREFSTRLKKLGLDELAFKQPHNWAGYLDPPPGAKPPCGPTASFPFPACTFPWNALVVFFNGDVGPCAQDFFAQRILGRSDAGTLLEIWNGPPMQELRRAFAAGKAAASPPCSTCDRLRRRTLGGVPAEYLKKLLFRRLN